MSGQLKNSFLAHRCQKQKRLLPVFVLSLTRWVPWISPEPSCGNCNVITSVDDIGVIHTQPYLLFIYMKKTNTKAAVAHSVIINELFDALTQRKVAVKL